jgi:5-methylcytosine-specific restriction endonuclease McrA
VAERTHPRPQPAITSRVAPTKKRGRRRKKGGGAPHSELTSHPTSRNAQIDTRAWLLKQYGPSCAYCGVKYPARVMTLDHVAPRRGQTAYDRRDNLVLACRACNALKRDQAPLAFLLAVKTRATNLLKYGAHLSAGLLAMARPLVKDAPPSTREFWGPDDDDGDSPYKD